jgi:ABC-type glycerol-3-phosphate transport system permease component
VSGRGRARDAAVLALLALWAVPFFWQALTSFKPDAELLAVDRLLRAAPTLAHYRVVLERSVMPDALLNSLGVAVLTTLLALALGVPGAYALARLPVPG